MSFVSGIKNTAKGGFTAFLERAHQEDLQRNNMFQVFFTQIPEVVTNPDSVNARYKIQGTTGILSNIGRSVNSIMGKIRSNPIGNALVSFGYDLARRHGVFRKIYTAFQPGLVDTVFGALTTGNWVGVADYAKFMETNIAVVSVNLPQSEINYEVEYNHRLQSINPTGRGEQKLAITFRNFQSNRDYVFFKKWVDSVVDEHGYQNFIEDVSQNIIVYTHDRRGNPTSVHYLYDCVPTQVSVLELSYDSQDVSTFTVEFFVRYHKVETVGVQKVQYQNAISDIIKGVL